MIDPALKCLLGASKPLVVTGISNGPAVTVHYYQRYVSLRFMREFEALAESKSELEAIEILRGLALGITERIEIDGKFYEPTAELFESIPSESLNDLLAQVMADSRPKASGGEISPDALPPKADLEKPTKSTPTSRSRSGSGSRRGSSTSKRRPGKTTP